jgi:multidrug efflux pump subunit AcrA (membrane-fusion protein)
MTLLRTPRTAAKAGVLLLLAGLWASCGRDAKEAEPSAAARTPVRVTHPILTDFTETIDLNASTFFLTREVVRATFQGFIERTFKTLGEDVKAGEPLFLIKTRESAAADGLKTAWSAGDTSKAPWPSADGLKTAWSAGDTSKAPWPSADGLKTAWSAGDTSKAPWPSADTLGFNFRVGGSPFSGSVVIRAKTDGVLTALDHNTGDFVSDGEQIGTVSNPASLRLALNVPFAFVRRIRRGEPCTLFLPDGSVSKATIQRALPSVDPESQTQTFLLRPDGTVPLPENLNVIVRLPLLTARRVMGVPKSAVMSDETQETFWIMKLVNDSTAVRFDAVKGIENDSLVQIIRPPLRPDDRVVSDGAYGLPDTAAVTLIGK